MVSCALVASPCLPLLADEPPPSVAQGSPIAREVLTLVDKYYLDRSFGGMDMKRERTRLEEGAPLSEQQALDESIKLVKSLGDRYSRVLSPKDAVKLGKYDVTGVGINLVISDDGAVKVGGVPPADSDAAVLGVEFGDVVLTINGKVCDGMTSFDALEAIQGDKDVVNLRIRSANGGGERDVSLRKTFTTRNPVSYKLVTSDDGRKTGYIKLSEFNAQCKKKVREAVRNLEAEGASGLVLDMRGNGGGVLDGAIGIAGLFMERPLVLYVTDANGAMQPLYSREAVVSTELPLQVWVDATTASSAEVLAAALRDNCRASVVGGTTYGKGVIQGVFGLSDGGALIETVASYATPAKEEINKRGVRPDEKKTFISDVMGSSWVDADIKAASLGQRSTATTCTDKPSAASTKMAATSASATRTD